MFPFKEFTYEFSSEQPILLVCVWYNGVCVCVCVILIATSHKKHTIERKDNDTKSSQDTSVEWMLLF